MKKPILAGLLGATLLLTACETRVVDRDRYHNGYAYRNGGPDVVVDARSPGHYDDRYHNNTYVTNDRTNVERTNVTNINQTNVNRTNVNRITANRTTVQANVKQNPHPGTQAAQAQPNRTVQKVPQKGKVVEKKKDETQPQ